MFHKKRKILFCSEASFAHSGFGTIYKELISRIHASGKFRIAEFGSEAYVNDFRDSDIKWRFYPNGVTKNDPRYGEYDSSKLNHHGRWRFEKVCLDFEPDIVVDLRDPPFFEYQGISCLRKYFHWCIGPTVDSKPQHNDFMEIFLSADSVAPYTEFGYDTISEQSPHVKLVPNLGPGINLQNFRPMNKGAIRRKYNLDSNLKIIGYVSRNQTRKRFPELIQCFGKALEITGSTDAYLHLHTGIVDNQTWNIAKILAETSTYNRVLFTYWCPECDSSFLEVYQGYVTECRSCKKKVAVNPRTGLGTSQTEMTEIYNLYDFYVQLSNCEGLGYGVLEAASSGIPFAATNYSAMESLNKDLNGTKINYVLSRDIIVDAERAIPDKNHLVEILCDKIDTPKELLAIDGMKTRELCEKKYCWDDISERWITHLSNIKLQDLQGKWGSPLRHEISLGKPTGTLDKMRRGFEDINRPDMKYSYIEQDLYNKYRLQKHGIDDGITEEDFKNYLTNLSVQAEKYLSINSGQTALEPEDFIRYADIKEMSNL